MGRGGGVVNALATPFNGVPDELDGVRAMDVSYADRLPCDLPMADFEDADGNLRRRERDGNDPIERRRDAR
jgi:hypothetical protein